MVERDSTSSWGSGVATELSRMRRMSVSQMLHSGYSWMSAKSQGGLVHNTDFNKHLHNAITGLTGRSTLLSSEALAHLGQDAKSLELHPITLTFREPGVEAEFMANVAVRRRYVLMLIFCFDVVCYVFRALVKLLHKSQDQGSLALLWGLLPQLANMVLLYTFLVLLNRRSRRLGNGAAKQEEILLSCVMALAISNLLVTLRKETAQDYVFAAMFLICTSAFLKIRWLTGVVIFTVPVGLACVWHRHTNILPSDAEVHLIVSWGVGALLSYLSETYRRQMFANHKLARAAAEKEIQEAQARIDVQQQLALAQAQAAQRALAVAREKAASEAKSEFMSLMCHEVRTPLNGCLASAEMLLETPLQEEQRELAKTICVSGSILLSTVSNFLDFFKMEAGKQLDVVRMEITMRELVDDIHCIIEAMIGRSSEIALSKPVIEGVPDVVLGDADRLRGILLNLYTNAAKFTRKGAILLRVRVAGPGYRPRPQDLLDLAASKSGSGGVSITASEQAQQPAESPNGLHGMKIVSPQSSIQLAPAARVTSAPPQLHVPAPSAFASQALQHPENANQQYSRQQRQQQRQVKLDTMAADAEQMLLDVPMSQEERLGFVRHSAPVALRVSGSSSGRLSEEDVSAHSAQGSGPSEAERRQASTEEYVSSTLPENEVVLLASTSKVKWPRGVRAGQERGSQESHPSRTSNEARSTLEPQASSRSSAEVPGTPSVSYSRAPAAAYASEPSIPAGSKGSSLTDTEDQSALSIHQPKDMSVSLEGQAKARSLGTESSSSQQDTTCHGINAAAEAAVEALGPSASQTDLAESDPSRSGSPPRNGRAQPPSETHDNKHSVTDSGMGQGQSNYHAWSSEHTGSATSGELKHGEYHPEVQIRLSTSGPELMIGSGRDDAMTTYNPARRSFSSPADVIDSAAEAALREGHDNGSVTSSKRRSGQFARGNASLNTDSGFNNGSMVSASSNSIGSSKIPTLLAKGSVNSKLEDMGNGWFNVIAQRGSPAATGRGGQQSSTRPGGIAPIAEGGPAGMVEQSQQRWLVFEVSDTGCGIGEAGLASLFKEYVQGTEDEMKRPRSKGGTGLGLSICSKQVAVLGGHIGALSKPGVGSNFWFTMPLLVAEKPSPRKSLSLRRTASWSSRDAFTDGHVSDFEMAASVAEHQRQTAAATQRARSHRHAQHARHRNVRSAAYLAEQAAQQLASKRVQGDKWRSASEPDPAPNSLPDFHSQQARRRSAPEAPASIAIIRAQAQAATLEQKAAAAAAAAQAQLPSSMLLPPEAVTSDASLFDATQQETASSEDQLPQQQGQQHGATPIGMQRGLPTAQARAAVARALLCEPPKPSKSPPSARRSLSREQRSNLALQLAAASAQPMRRSIASDGHDVEEQYVMPQTLSPQMIGPRYAALQAKTRSSDNQRPPPHHGVRSSGDSYQGTQMRSSVDYHPVRSSGDHQMPPSRKLLDLSYAPLSSSSSMASSHMPLASLPEARASVQAMPAELAASRRSTSLREADRQSLSLSESKDNRGSWPPKQPGRASERPSMEARRKKLDTSALQGRRVLLAEDNLINQTVAKKMLCSLGMVVEVAANGVEAVEAIRRRVGLADNTPPAQRQFDVILMDMAMPVMGGVDATKVIRRAGEEIPIVAMTANASDRDRDECLEAGMDGFLSKPVLRDRLAEAILSVVSGRRNFMDKDTVALKPYERL